MDSRPVVIRVDMSRETGEVMVLLETDCGFRPLLGWPNVKGMQEFATTLLGICSSLDNGKGDLSHEKS